MVGTNFTFPTIPKSRQAFHLFQNLAKNICPWHSYVTAQDPAPSLEFPPRAPGFLRLNRGQVVLCNFPDPERRPQGPLCSLCQGSYNLCGPGESVCLLCPHSWNPFASWGKPEMIKCRPVVVLGPKRRDNKHTATVVVLSTKEPKYPQRYHRKIVFEKTLPRPFNKNIMWVKGDMIYTLSIERMERPFKWIRGRPLYKNYFLPNEEFDKVLDCVRSVMGDQKHD